MSNLTPREPEDVRAHDPIDPFEKAAPEELSRQRDLLRDEVRDLREQLRHSPTRARELENRVLQLQTSLATLSTQNERLVRTLNQKERAPRPIEDQVVEVFAATNGFLDRIAVERVPEFLDGLTSRTHAEHEDLLTRIGEGDWSDETQEAVRGAVADFADDFGYDLDEEGQPLDEREVGETTREQEGIRASSDADGGDEGDAEASADQEEAAAPA